MTEFSHSLQAKLLETPEAGGMESEPFDVKRLVHRYPNYLKLLGTELEPDDSMDAIIVPAARPIANIEAAAQLAKSTGALLIALCSHDAMNTAMADSLDNMSVPAWWAIDVPKAYKIPSVELTSAEEIPEQSRRICPSNLSDKRNIGVALAKMTGLGKIMFMDDDVTIDDRTVRDASIMLGGFKIVGLHCMGFPDKAVVDHAESRIIAHHQSKVKITIPADMPAGHISGNSIAVDPQNSGIFFPPEIYDEDLLAFYDFYAERTAALVNSGGYRQANFDPFADSDRARTEEFGEIIMDGLYQHLKQQLTVEFTDERYWNEIITQRRSFIRYLLSGLDSPQNKRYFNYMTTLPTFDPKEKQKVRNSLEAAQNANAAITGKMCVEYYRAWQADQAKWRKYLSHIPDKQSTQAGIEELELFEYATNTG